MTIDQIPAIPDINAKDPANTQESLVAIKEVLEVMLGRRGSNEDLQVLFQSDLDTLNTLITSGASGVVLIDTGNDDTLTFKLNENLTADRILNFVVGDSDRTITFSGSPTLGNWFDQAVKVASSPTFAGVTLGNTGLHILDTDDSHDLIIKPGSDLSADKTLTLTTGDSDRTITLSGNPTLSDWFDQSVKVASTPTFANLLVADAGNIGSVSDTDAIAIAADGKLTLTQDLTVNEDIIIGDGKYIGSATTPTAMQIASTGIVTFVDDIIIADGGTIGPVSFPSAMDFLATGEIGVNKVATAGEHVLHLKQISTGKGIKIEGADRTTTSLELFDDDLFTQGVKSSNNFALVAASALNMYTGAGGFLMFDGVLGSAPTAALEVRFDAAAGSFGQCGLFPSSSAGSQIIIGPFAWRGNDFGRPFLTDPFLYIFSGTDPDTKDTEYLSFTFTETIGNAVFGLGEGAYTFPDGDFHLGSTDTPETQFEMSGTAPYHTFHNTTHENTNLGRELRQIFKGEKGDGTEHTLARMEVSHEGTGDDYLGQIILSTNTNGGADTLVDALKIDSTQNTVLPKTAGKGMKVDIDTPTFGWRDLKGKVTQRNVGASKPTHATYRDTLAQYQFAAGKEEYFTYHIDHDHVPDSDIFLHVHWSHNNAFVNGGTITLEYEISYAKGFNQAPFGASVSTTFAGTASTTQYQHITTEVQVSAVSPDGNQIDSNDLEPDGIIEARVKVTSNDITVSQGGVPDPFIHEADMHYQSTGMGTKQKAPDFYT